MLDFDVDNMDIEGSMDWGIPLINMEYDIDQILIHFGNSGYLSTESNGDYFYEYRTENQDYFDIEEYNKIENSENNFYLHFPEGEFSHKFIENFVDISTDEMKILKATFKSGQIKFDFTSVSPSNNSNYDIHITSNSIFKADGTPFVKLLSKSNPIAYEPCAGMLFKDENSRIDFVVTITLNSAPTSPLQFKMIINMIDVKMQDADIEIIKNKDKNFVESSSFSFFQEDPNLQATLHNPKFVIDAVNTFGCELEILLSKLYITEGTNTQNLLLNDNQLIPVPQNFNGTIDVSKYITSDIRLTSNDCFYFFEYVFLIPEGKRFTMRETSVAEAALKLLVPFDITIDRAVFSDTLSFGIKGLSQLSFFDTVQLRTGFSSSVPCNFDVQIVLYNSELQQEIANLLPEPVTIKGSYNGISVPSGIQFVNLTKERLRELQQADQMILRFSLGTGNKHFPFNRNNSIDAKVGARIKIQNKS